MSEMKPTPGPWEVYTPAGEGQTYGVSADDGAAVVWFGYNAEEGIQNFDDARLIAEAGTVFHNTGLSPVQLVEQRDELVAVVKALIAYDESDHEDGVQMMLDYADMLKGAYAALAKCEGVK